MNFHKNTKIYTIQRSKATKSPLKIGISLVNIPKTLMMKTGGGVVVDLEAQDEEHTRYNLVTGVTMLIRTGNPLPNIAEGPMANIASPTQIIKLF